MKWDTHLPWQLFCQLDISPNIYAAPVLSYQFALLICPKTWSCTQTRKHGRIHTHKSAPGKHSRRTPAAYGPITQNLSRLLRNEQEEKYSQYLQAAMLTGPPSSPPPFDPSPSPFVAASGVKWCPIVQVATSCATMPFACTNQVSRLPIQHTLVFPPR